LIRFRLTYLIYCLIICTLIFPTIALSSDSNHEIAISLGGIWTGNDLNQNDDDTDLLGYYNLTNGIGPQVEISYYVSPKISCGLGMEYQHCKKSGKYYYPEPSDPQYIRYVSKAFEAFIPSFEVKYYIPSTHCDYFISISSMLCFGTFKSEYSTEPLPPLGENFKDSYSGNGYGVSLAIGLQKSIYGRIGSSILAGYRYLQTGKLFSKSTNTAFRFYGKNANFDFNGPYIEFSLFYSLYK
jgi:hypothetical protein